MAKQTFTTGQVLTAAQMTDLQATALGGGAASTKTANYVLVAADAGTTVAMNAAGATTITVNTGLFAAGDTVFIQNVGAGVCTITAGTATVNTAGALALPQYDAGILYFTSASAAIFYDYIQVGAASPLTTKGDLYTFSTSDTRLGVGANGTVLTAASGEATGLQWATPSSTPTFVGCVLTKSVGQTINNGSITDVTWDVEELDTNSFHSAVTNTDRVTIPSGYAGKYLVTAQLQYGNFSGGSNRLAVIYKNTTQIAYANVNVTRGTPFASYTCSMTVGDYFKVAAYQDSGTSNTLEGNNFTQGATIFQVIYLGV